jgi:DNA replication protein DnaC
MKSRCKKRPSRSQGNSHNQQLNSQEEITESKIIKIEENHNQSFNMLFQKSQLCKNSPSKEKSFKLQLKQKLSKNSTDPLMTELLVNQQKQIEILQKQMEEERLNRQKQMEEERLNRQKQLEEERATREKFFQILEEIDKNSWKKKGQLEKNFFKY